MKKEIMDTIASAIYDDFTERYFDLSDYQMAKNAFTYLKKITEAFPFVAPYFAKQLETITETMQTYVKKNWTEATGLYSMPLSEVLEIIDDGSCHGFEYKIENGKLYFRENTIC